MNKMEMAISFKLHVLLCFLRASLADWDHGLNPTIDGSVANVTVVEGETAILPCHIESLGEYKVAWLHQDSRLIIDDEKRITDDLRFNLEKPFHDDWNLHIKNVTYSDQGQYICRINTDPFTSKTVNVAVIVPAEIRNETSSNDTAIQEGEKLLLICNATGFPKPVITWYKFNSDGRQKMNSSSEMMVINNVTRLDSGTYECIANNGVNTSKQVKVSVEFAPEVTLVAKRIHQVIGREIILECKIVANPRPEMHWLKDNVFLEALDKEKYQVDTYGGYPDHTYSTLSLRLPNLRKDQLGEYTCIAENSICKNYDTVVVNEFLTSTVEKTVDTNIPVNNSYSNYSAALGVTFLAKRLGQLIGRVAILECKIISNPRPDMLWLKYNVTIELIDKKKHPVGEYKGWTHRPTTTLRLRLSNLQEDQLGEYTCYAKNVLGEAFDNMIVYEYSGAVPVHDNCSKSKGLQDEVSSGNTYGLDILRVLAFYWMANILA